MNYFRETLTNWRFKHGSFYRRFGSLYYCSKFAWLIAVAQQLAGERVSVTIPSYYKIW